jgi:hypothetical protein
MQLALLEEDLDLVDDPLIEAASADGLDRGQRGLPSGLWSGGLTRVTCGRS